MSFFVAQRKISSYDNEVNRRRLFNCIVDERIQWMGERGEDGVAVEQSAIKADVRAPQEWVARFKSYGSLENL